MNPRPSLRITRPDRREVMQALRVLGVVGALLAVALGVWQLEPTGRPQPGGGPEIPWWVLAVLFGAVEVTVLHVQVRREAQTLSLSEIPLTLGLFFASPLSLLVGRVLGPSLVFVFHRRQTPIKLAFNLALLAANAGLALLTFHLVLSASTSLGVRAWLATYLAAAVVGILDGLATSAVIAAYERSYRLRDLAGATLRVLPMSLVVATVALVAVYALSRDVLSAWPLVASAALLLLCYRGYASLSERHLSLERLYRFSQAVSSTPEVNQILRSVLAQAKELLRAESAEITFLAARDTSTGVRVVLGPSDRMVKGEVSDLRESDWLWSRVVTEVSPVLLARGTKDESLRTYLRLREQREAIMAPLRGEAGVVGTITVADRMGDVRTFDADDVRLLETVANHASVALQNGRLIDQLRHEALHDALTGLPNRVLLQRRITETLSRLETGDISGLAVMIMDLDGFKEVNDSLGHHHGDALLREVAGRSAAAAGPAATVARLGGDEFAILLPDVNGVEAAERGRKLLEALEHPLSVDEFNLVIGASIGISLAPDHAKDVSTLLKRADVAMYSAKGSSAGLRLYEASQETSIPQRLGLAGDLRTAIEHGQLRIHVQPQVELRTGDVRGVEALVRWQHPVHGLLPPDEFVPMAERSGLIRPLTMAVLRAALSACASWRADGVAVNIAVNLSARGLVDIDLADDVGVLLHRYALPPGQLTLEITESSIMVDPPRTIGLLSRLNAMGVRLSVDDFGTGYSSLSNLKRLPVHEVKIDKSFVTHMDSDADDATIVRSIVDLGGNLSLEVVAEGVEDAAAWDRLREMGCDLAQGYYLSRPMEPERFLGWLRDYEAQRADRVPATRAGAAAVL